MDHLKLEEKYGSRYIELCQDHYWDKSHALCWNTSEKKVFPDDIKNVVASAKEYSHKFECANHVLSDSANFYSKVVGKLSTSSLREMSAA